MYKEPLVKQGWLRALIAVLLAQIGIRILAFLFFNITLPQFSNPLLQLLFSYSINNGIILMLIVLLLNQFIDRRSFLSLGFQWKGFSSDAFTGFFTAVAILFAGTLLLIGLHFLYITDIEFHPNDLLIAIPVFIVVAFVEEILFRGYILQNLMESVHPFIALSISAIVFALFHTNNPNASFVSIFNIFIAGILLGINYIYTKNLWFGIFLHFAWNFLQGPILGYKVSGLETGGLLHQTLDGPALFTGGEFGFEGSLFNIILAIIVIALLTWRYEKQKSHII